MGGIGSNRPGFMGETKKALVERLFAQHSSALRAYFYPRVRHQPDAAELAQEVYLRMLRVNDTDAIRNPEAYLYTVQRAISTLEIGVSL